MPPQGHVHQASEQLTAAGQHARDFITHLFFGSPGMQAAMEAFAVTKQVSVAQQTSPFFSSAAAAISSSAGLAAAAADASSWSVQSVAGNATSSEDAVVSDEASTTVDDAKCDEQPAMKEQSEGSTVVDEHVHEHAQRLGTPVKALFITQEQHLQQVNDHSSPGQAVTATEHDVVASGAADEVESLLHCDYSDSDDAQTTASAASIPPRLLRRLSQRG
jgi:hypothetical protein